MTTANLQAVQGKYFIVKVKCSIDHHEPMVTLEYYSVDNDAVNIVEPNIPRVCQHHIPRPHIKCHQKVQARFVRTGQLDINRRCYK